MARLVFQPLDAIASKYGEQLSALGSPAKTYKVIARAANYEGRKAFVAVKRGLRRQSSIPNAIVQRSVRFQKASVTLGKGSVEVAIIGRGNPLSLKLFGAKQFKKGVRARVWGRLQTFSGTFMGPRPGTIAAKLGGHAFHREGTSRLPIKMTYGPSVARELVKDEAKAAFYASTFKIVDRVGKEIEAVLRGY